jgi:ABC-type multidrug transport system fused ATPase/permease subunit
LGSANQYLGWIARNQKYLLSLGVFWGITWFGFQALIPGALGAGVQAVTDQDVEAVVLWAAAVLALGLAQALAGVMRHRFAVWSWLAAASRTQQLIVRHATFLGGDLPTQIATGEAAAAASNDSSRIGNAFEVVQRFVGAIVAFVGIAVLLLSNNLLLGMVVVLGAPLLALAVGPLVKPLERRERDQRERLGKATELAADTVAGLRVIRGIGGEELFLGRFRTASQRVLEAAVHTARIKSLLDGLQVLLPGLYTVTVTWLGARLAVQGDITVGQLVAFYGYTAFLVFPLRTITEFAQKWTAAKVAAVRVERVLSLDRLVSAPGTAPEPPDGDLVDVSSGLVVRSGRLTAVAADDPDAADRVSARLGRFADGTVELAGAALDELPTEVVRRRILVQDKDPTILSGAAGSLFDIPRSGQIAVADALDTASAVDVIESLPDGLSTDLPERGRSLSGGQRQRLALARSLVADPPILVLDEPTSAVDAHTEARIGERLRQARAGRTTVVFTTSPLLLDHADEVALLVDGTVVATGKHRELLHSNPQYRVVVLRGGGD